MLVGVISLIGPNIKLIASFLSQMKEIINKDCTKSTQTQVPRSPQGAAL